MAGSTPRVHHDQKRRILVVDDDHENLKFLSEVLEAANYDVQTADSGASALQKIEEWNPELVLLDYTMPGLNGLETLHRLRQRQNYVAVIFVSGNASPELVIQCLGGGADDYILKPFDFGEMIARIRVRFRNKDVNDELEAANEKLKDLAEKDDLTGLYNMRFIYQKIEHELKRAKRFGRSMAVLMMDLDHFKSVNDEFDHLFGSFVLKEIGAIISKSMRDIDFAARYGGDEFLMCLTETDPEGAKSFGERLRKAIGGHVFKDGDNVFQRTASLGLAISDPNEEIVAKELVRRADHALYTAKETGRNKVVTYDRSIDRKEEGGKVLKLRTG